MKILKKSLASLTALAALTSISACATDTGFDSGLSDVTTIASKADANKAKWTFIVHLAADNNLYGFGLKDMAEMAYGYTDSKDVNVIVLFDGTKTGDSGIYKVSHSDKKPAMNAAITSPRVDDGGEIVPASKEINSGDPKLLAKFMNWATKKYPAEHTALVVWNHGSGIFRNGVTYKPVNATKGKSGQITTNGFAWDDNGGNMNLKDLGPILAPAMQNLGKKIDILDFDACLMAHVEAAYQVKDHVNYLVASEKTEAGDGNDYVGLMKALSSNPNISGAEYAKSMVDIFAKSYLPGGNQYTGRPEEYTLSATDTSAVANGLLPSISNLASDLVKNPEMARNAWNAATTYDGDPEPRDLGHFLSLLSKDSKAAAVKAKADAVNAELKKAVIRETHTGKAVNGLSDSTGLVIYMPGPGGYMNSKYTNPAETKMSENPQWVNFLKAFIALK